MGLAIFDAALTTSTTLCHIRLTLKMRRRPQNRERPLGAPAKGSRC
jgi:hypothetical protein